MGTLVPPTCLYPIRMNGIVKAQPQLLLLQAQLTMSLATPLYEASTAHLPDSGAGKDAL
jgi:hypothetical protein